MTKMPYLTAGVTVILDDLVIPPAATSHSSRKDDDAPPPDDDVWVPDSDMSDLCIDRHQGFINGLFCDGSVRKVGLKELWTLKWHREYDTTGPWTKAGGVQPEDWPQWMRRFKDY